MAQQDASAAIQNTLQRLNSQPNLPPEVEFKSVKSKLQRLGSHLDKFSNSIPELTQARDIAYNVEDAMDEAIVSVAAQKRWRKLGNVVSFFSKATAADEINQQVEKQAEDIERLFHQEKDIERLTITWTPSDEDATAAAKEQQDTAEEEGGGHFEATAAEKDVFVLSLSAFRAGVEVSARRLIQIWVAEGFHGPQGRPVTEEEGREQVEALLGRGFLTEPKRGTYGDLKAFTLDEDKLREWREAADKQQFLHVLGSGNISSEAPRLAIHDHGSNDDLTRVSNLPKQLRSLQIHCPPAGDKTRLYSYRRIPDAVKRKLETLRVLDLGCVPIDSVPDWIGKLTHLKYLRLNAPLAARIPSSICKLENLQTIDLKETERVRAVPVAIWRMKKNLRHLHLGGAAAFPPPRMANHYDALESLQSLCGVRPDRELKRLMVRAKFPNVTRLRLSCTSKKESNEFLSFLNSLDHLYHLRSLTLVGPIQGLPKDWNAFPSSLVKMTLSKTRIPAAECVKTLENLPNLRYLKLMVDSVTKTEMHCAGGGFPALRVLTMEGLKELERWRVGKGAMRLLKKVEVTKCQKLKRVEAETPSEDLARTLRELGRNCPDIQVLGC